ncbi:MAG: hypothetical protein BJ554DRAFT_1079 [Olpidium bornovanus]|uniref:SRP54-type proteins GTP-binding domain-containing protein n=1 Tax=Olpidium bornovanus TaxID=278681 RepID=A0A8H7ZT24_9FUNG|nr:MAG: hypothetical protein BJ554DRAFT_1079 [Olpidium bornovanus]
MGKITGREGFYEVADLGDVISEEDDDEDEIVAPPRADAGTARRTESGVFSFFKNFAGARALTEKDLELALGKTKEHLIKKNVAADIAQHLCDSVGRSVVGQKISAFNSVQKTVKTSLAHALKKILTPKTSTDLLRDIVAARAEKRPYVVTFIGVNGVGKVRPGAFAGGVVASAPNTAFSRYDGTRSTNLAKTCFWLLQNKFRVLIAACDTFRSGAVEQLRVHARNLRALSSDLGNVELFERGYGKDSAGIAREAITYGMPFFPLETQEERFRRRADRHGRAYAGQRALDARFGEGNVNDPDKIIFVGEALVGNEAVDQLRKFNRALKAFSGTANPRQIDGMILTKFDTIDDKVGAALSMTYTTGQPILFVGTGQTYTDLKTMRVEHIVQSLLKD